MIDYGKILNPTVSRDIKPSGIRKFFDIAATMDDVISLGVGEPDFPTPWHIRRAGIKSLEESRTRYTSNSGLIELRREICAFLKRKYSLDYAPDSEVLVTVGGSEGIDAAIRALVAYGDEVIIPQPSFVCYEPIVRLSGGVPVVVNLNYANQGTRAGEVFENGIEAENAIKDVTFFFFDANENAYTVNTNDFDDAGTGVPANSITVTKEQLGEMQGQTNGNPVEEISNAVLVIERNKVTPPSYMLAVVNCPNALKTAGYSLAQLKNETGAYNTITDGDTKYFVMANSVYVNGAGEAMYATPITNDNLAPTADAAKTGNPVEIYVERTAVKVRLNNLVSGEEDDIKFPVYQSDGQTPYTTKDENNVDQPVYAKIIGWHVTDINNEAYLLKNIEANWTDVTTGISGWNDVLNYRSYWATSEDATANRHPHSGNVIKGHKVPFDYYYENTGANHSQLVVLAQFFVGSAATESATIAEWWGVKYTLAGLRTAIANSLASELYIKGTDGKYTSITPEYIDFQQVTNNSTSEDAVPGRYWSNAVLAPDKVSTPFFNAQGQPLDQAAVTAIFEGVRHAKIWSQDLGGYYYLDIAHVGTQAPGNFGMVRNHLYEYTINNIVGLGTPVFDGNQIIVPEKPEEEETYIAAKLNVQAWRVVTNSNVTLQ